MSPTTAEYDYEYNTWIQDGRINPQGRTSVEFSERGDFKTFKPCFFSPVEVYELQ
jgi:hypothetical protein